MVCGSPSMGAPQSLHPCCMTPATPGVHLPRCPIPFATCSHCPLCIYACSILPFGMHLPCRPDINCVCLRVCLPRSVLCVAITVSCSFALGASVAPPVVFVRRTSTPNMSSRGIWPRKIFIFSLWLCATLAHLGLHLHPRL